MDSSRLFGTLWDSLGLFSALQNSLGELEPLLRTVTVAVVKSSINQDGTTRSQNGIDHGLKQTLDLARFVKNLTTANANSEELTQKLSMYKVLALRAWFLIDHTLHGPQNKNLGDAYWKYADQLVSSLWVRHGWS